MLVSLLGGCMAPDMVDTGSWSQQGAEPSQVSDCELVAERSVTFDEDLGGYTASGVLNRVQGIHNKTLTWANATTTGIALTLSGVTNAAIHDFEVSAAANGSTDPCTDHLVINMNLQVSTVDGQLNFYAPVDVRAYSADVMGFTLSLDRSDIFFNPAAWVEESFDSLRSELGAEWVGAELVGQITAYGEQAVGDGDEASVTVTSIIIGQF